MKFVYGKQNWRTKSRGQENGYLLTNGRGGFSSCTMLGSNTRNDHAILMAAVTAPNIRFNMVHHIEEEICMEEQGKWVSLSSQDYVYEKSKEGYRYLDGFSMQDYPVWDYRIGGISIKKEIAMKQGENAVAIRYSISNRTNRNAKVKVIPHLQFVAKGQLLEQIQQFEIRNQEIVSNGLHLYVNTNGRFKEVPKRFVKGFYYERDACDGRCETGNTVVNHQIEMEVMHGEEKSLFVVYQMEKEQKISVEDVDAIFKLAVLYNKKLVDIAGYQKPITNVLVRSANQFIVDRDSTNGKTILAGYPFFEDWGRDTMIALTGCCICTKQYEIAKSILRTFVAYCKEGMMPNLFPEGGKEPLYNTVDAALLFIYAVYQYMKATKDIAFLRETWHTMQEIITFYKNGTEYHIYMDKDGLISAGNDLEQLTWMDVRIGDLLPTPRHGKPVEINAYWYNALCFMQEFAAMLEEDGTEYQVMANQAKKSFETAFWNEELGCLRDVVSGTKADNQIRCNQIWVVSMPYSLLDSKKEEKVVQCVYEKLYTPYGLRTLAIEDPEFVGVYEGEQKKRDLAYHQGTVWSYPLGAYYMAYLKVNHNSLYAIEKVKSQLSILESTLREGCIGQLPEIYDGLNPSISKGCFAQAWSVGEMLRVFTKIEELEGEVK